MIVGVLYFVNSYSKNNSDKSSNNKVSEPDSEEPFEKIPQKSINPSGTHLIYKLLEKYENEGILAIDDTNVLRVNPLSSMGSAVELVNSFGGKQDFDTAIKELERELYKSA